MKNEDFVLFDINIAVGSKEELYSRASALIGRGGAISTVNPEILANAVREAELKSALAESLCIPDGIGVELALRRLGRKTERFPGVELGEALLEGDKCVRLGIIGGREGVAVRALEELTAKHRNVIPEFALSGYGIDKKMVGELLSNVRPDIVFVCLGSPAQEIFIKDVRRFSEKTLFIALGGSVDIYSGEKRRAPMPFRVLGLEWAWRIMLEPKRLARVPNILRFYVNLSKSSRKSGKIGKKLPKFTR